MTKIKIEVNLEELAFTDKLDFKMWLDSMLDTRKLDMQKLINKRKQRNAKADADIEILYKRIYSDKQRLHMKKAEILDLGADLASHMIVRRYIDALVARGSLKEGFPKGKMYLLERLSKS